MVKKKSNDFMLSAAFDLMEERLDASPDQLTRRGRIVVDAVFDPEIVNILEDWLRKAQPDGFVEVSLAVKAGQTIIDFSCDSSFAVREPGFVPDNL